MTQHLTTTTVEKKQQALAEAEADYRAGVLSVNATARKHGLAESTLRREARRRGWPRATPDNRRKLVAEAMSGAHMASGMAEDKALQLQADAAAQDMRDMNTGLAVARKVLNRLLDMVDETGDPRDLKVVVEANRAAIDTIRKIRSLDAEAPAAQATVSIDVSDGFAELRAAFAKRLDKPTGS